MTGRRLNADSSGEYRWPDVQPGDYFTYKGQWYASTPTGLRCNLSGHQVTEHEDGTITVSPSILVNRGQENEWHGFLERGVWRSC